MMTGQVTARRQALVSARLRGPDGAEVEVSAILDTGFSEHLTLPVSLIEAMALPRRDTVTVILADGSRQRAAVYETRLLWNGAWRAIPIQASDGDPLIGMALLLEHLVSLEVRDGGAVTIEQLE